jgi:hypothetical protein
MNETFHICERCREEVQRDDPNVVEAAKQVDVTGFGSTSREYVDGIHVFFHDLVLSPRIAGVQAHQPVAAS